MSDLTSEALFIGSLYAKPILFVDYAELIKSKYDFDDPDTKFLYDSFELYYKTFSQEISETKVNIFMQQDSERLKHYKKIGGWKTIQKQMELADPDDIKNYFDNIKKYSLLREFHRKGFPVEKLMQHKAFSKMKAEDIVRFMRYNVDNINTVIGGGKAAIQLGKDIQKKLIKWREAPDMGVEFPFPIWTELFRGFRKKKLVVDGMLSNEGKSRRMAKIVNYLGVLKKIPVLVLVNEQDEDEWYAMQASTICNNEEFGFCYNIREYDIVLGNYKSEEEFDYVCNTVGSWIKENHRIYFLELSQYSDEDLEREIKKHVLGLGVQYVFYDTLKGYKTDNWETVKQTTTKLKDLANELNIGAYATIQLTDETVFTDVEDLTSMNIANAKQLKHVVDHLILEKRIDKSKYDNYLIKNEWGEMPLNPNKIYYGQKIDKNRGGGKGMVLATEVDLDRNIWKEVGYLIRKPRDKKRG
jgi:replicative DNA helicase